MMTPTLWKAFYNKLLHALNFSPARKLIGLLLSGIAFASELPDFRKYAREYPYAGSHFRIIVLCLI